MWLNEESAYGIWTKLKNLYMSKMLTNKLYPKKQLYALHMGEGTKFLSILHGKNSIELKDVPSAFLLNEKMRRKPENHGQALITESRGRSYQRSSSNYGRSGARGKSKVRSKSKARNC
ncbi:hypothetical protein R3W88_031985 [Solanum pinnatisectum]|uniref:Uncharacterized protein n=1 Tax=Solanum pinnatisectum TaxID=50273 RepID=A0AAV9LNI0_9SOLN|nr:hypothetical protein R3W88_031985 [Solanum pinnatisectum]